MKRSRPGETHHKFISGADCIVAVGKAMGVEGIDACRPGNPRDTSVDETAALYRGLMYAPNAS